MKRLIISVVLVLAVSCLIFGQAKKQTQATSAEQELIQAEKDLTNAVVKRNLTFYDQAQADEFVLTDYNGSLSTKAEILANLKSGSLVVTSAVFDDVKARAWGDAGVTWSLYTEKSQSNGQDGSGQYRRTSTWIRRSGHWQVVAGHTSKVVKQ